MNTTKYFGLHEGRMFTFDQRRFACHPPLSLKRATKLSPMVIVVPMDCPEVKDLVYDVHPSGMRVVSGFLLDDDTRILVNVPHYGKEWQRWKE